MEKPKYFINENGGVHWSRGSDPKEDGLLTPKGRAAFVYLAKRNDKFVNSKTNQGKYSVTMLFDKSDPTVREELKKIQYVCLEMLDFYACKEYEKTPKKMKYDEFKKHIYSQMSAQPIFRDGDHAKYEGFEGHLYIVAKNNENSGTNGIIFSQNRRPEDFEAGQIVRAIVRPYVDGKGFAYQLRQILLVSDDGFRFQGAAREDLLAGLDEAVEAVNGSDLSAHYDKAVSESSGLNVL